MATHSSVLAWRIPETREPGGLLSTGSHRVGHDWSNLAAAAAADGLVLPSLEEFSTECCVLHSQRLWHSHNFPEWPSKSYLAPLCLMVLIIVHSQDDSIISMRKSILGSTQWGQFTPSSLLFGIQLILVLLLCSLRSSIQQRGFQGSCGIRESPEPSNRALIIKVAVGNHTRTSPEPSGKNMCPQLCKEMGCTVSPLHVNKFYSESAFVKSNKVSLGTRRT